jgi:hypothetical protein
MMKRYEMYSGDYGSGACMEEEPDGEWVRYADAARMLDELGRFHSFWADFGLKAQRDEEPGAEEG